jgi:glycosyltransferase involved in cell wall biosynthesis
MSDHPLVSVIIPSYNRERLIIKSVNSVLNQTFTDYEILIIDDASTDNTKEVIDNLKLENIRYFRLEKNGGQCIARNFGIKQAKGDYIAFLDSDDEWLPRKLELQVKCFEEGPDNLGCVYGFCYQTDVIKNETITVNENFHRGNIRNTLIEGFCPPTPSLFMVKKSALQDVSGFDEKLITFVDLDIWIRLSEKYHFDYIEEPIIVKYEQIGDQYVNNFEKRYNGYKLFMNKWRDIIIREAGEQSLFILESHLTNSLVTPILNHPPKNLRKHIFKLIKLLLDVKSKNSRFYLKSLLILVFGPNIIYYIRKKIN